jgi:hypothetical protein
MESATMGGEFEDRRACVLWVIAPAPVRHARANTTDMLTTQGQAAFGHNTQTIKLTQIWSKLFKTCTVGRSFSMHVERTYSEFKHSQTNLVNYFNFRIIPEPECQVVTPVKFGSPQDFMRRFVRGLTICFYQFFIPIEFRA